MNCKSRRLFLFLTFALPVVIRGQFVDPLDVAQRAVSKAIWAMSQENATYRSFGDWGYEGGAIVRGLWEIFDTFPELNSVESFLHSHLNYFLQDPDERGYKILNDIPLGANLTDLEGSPWGYSIGDEIVLFPIGYADRLRFAKDASQFTYADDFKVINDTVHEYVYGYPFHLDDGTISRPISWIGEGYFEPDRHTLWVDDSFMGTSLTTSLSLETGDPEYVIDSARQLLNFRDYLIIESDLDELYYHGYDNSSGDMSCCKWGRGDGWALIAKMEALEVMDIMGLTFYPEYDQLLTDFRNHCDGLWRVQDPEGRWHNVLTNSSTYMETSATAMYMTAFVKGIERGWIGSTPYSDSVIRAWNALAPTVLPDGEVLYIQPGTGIKADESGYEPRDTEYENCSPGLGAVLRAIAAAGRFFT